MRLSLSDLVVAVGAVAVGLAAAFVLVDGADLLYWISLIVSTVVFGVWSIVLTRREKTRPGKLAVTRKPRRKRSTRRAARHSTGAREPVARSVVREFVENHLIEFVTGVILIVAVTAVSYFW